MFKLPEKDVVEMLEDKIKYNSNKRAVLVIQDTSVVQEIPLEAYEKSYWEDDSDKQLEKEINYIDYANAWWYEVADNKVVLKSVVRLGGENLYFGLLSLDDNEETIATYFDVMLKDESFYLKCIQE